MLSLGSHAAVSRFVSSYGMSGVLAVLCVYYSAATYQKQQRVAENAAHALTQEFLSKPTTPATTSASVLIAAGEHEEDVRFADSLSERLADGGCSVVAKVNGSPVQIRRVIERTLESEGQLDVIAVSTGMQEVVGNIQARTPALANTQIVSPKGYWWPTFLKLDNLLAVAKGVVVIAVIAVGMTMVIITGGIDLSVGSLVALSAVLTAKLIVACGGLEATTLEMILCALAAIAICAGVGGFSGLMITAFGIPPFIATLAMMEVARGLALRITRSESISGLPASFDWLGLDADLLGIPNAVVLMVLVYLAAQLVMWRTRLGRHIYAVGGNRQAARLSGISVNRVLLVVYIIAGAAAGLGGVIEASKFTSGDPKSGLMYELQVIAAVVVGGTSLSGGEGRISGTLIGAFIIAVIKNGMNLTNVESNTQRIVLGLAILGAVLLDTVRKRGRRWKDIALLARWKPRFFR